MTATSIGMRSHRQPSKWMTDYLIATWDECKRSRFVPSMLEPYRAWEALEPTGVTSVTLTAAEAAMFWKGTST